MRTHARNTMLDGMSAGIRLLALAGFAACATAQDSVSTNANGGNGLPGDALSPFATGQPFQRANYIVDLAAFETSGGTTFGIGPVLKSVKVSDQRFNAVNGPSAMSAAVRTTTLASTNFAAWSAAGAGLSPTQSNTGATTSVGLSGDASTFGVAVLDFDEQAVGPNLGFVNAITSASVRFVPANPSRLYVTRTGIAINSAAASGDNSQFGLGAVDINGSTMFRADAFQSLGSSPITGENYFLVTAPQRLEGTVNTINSAGGANASNRLLNNNATTTATPTMVPAEAGNGAAAVLGANFAGQLITRAVGGALNFPVNHRPGAIDHRGAPAFTTAPLFAGSRGTAAILTRSTGGGGKTDSISVFAVSSGNTITDARTLTMPANVTDACDAFSWPINGGDFRQYDNQSVFRGGTGPVAIGRDLQGRGLVAATVYNGTQLGSDNPFNAILAGRFDPANANPAQWTVVAWVDTVGSDGKDILGDFGADGAPGTGDAGENDGVVNQLDATIGRIASLAEGASGLTGPSLSAPAFDSAGNAYFIASVSLKKAAGQIIQEERDVALVRAVLNPSTFCYSLELVLEQGQTIAGLNSGRNYRVAWLGLADEDSIASASLWSGNVASEPWTGGTTQLIGFSNASPQHLGGLAVSARIVYDVDQNGQFNDPTAVGGVQTSTDEAYNVVLYVGNITGVGPSCDGVDFNNDGSFFDPTDIDAFLSVFSEGPCVPPTATCNDVDFNNDGSVFDPCDIDSFLLVFSEGPCTACGN
jgi:hypothetical protein